MKEHTRYDTIYHRAADNRKSVQKEKEKEKEKELSADE